MPGGFRPVRYIIVALMLPITPSDVRAAAARLAGIASRTPLVRSAWLSSSTGGDVFLKLETDQVTGSFKIRGAFNAIASLPADVRARGVVASSAGNHGLGVAWAARHFGIPATIYVPRTAPRVKREGIERLGAAVDATSPDYDEAMLTAKRVAEERGLRYINPCLGDDVLAGQGTVALEILEQMPGVATVVVPVGGAGLLGGVASFLRAEAPAVRILGAQSERTNAVAASLDAGRVVPVTVMPTLADGLSGQIDDAALAIAHEGLDGLALVSEAEIAGAIRLLLEHENVRAEGAAATAVAALLAGRLDTTPPVVVVLSGRNIDDDRLALIRDAGAPSDAPAGAG